METIVARIDKEEITASAVIVGYIDGEPIMMRVKSNVEE